jgi:hypothetical protein
MNLTENIVDTAFDAIKPLEQCEDILLDVTELIYESKDKKRSWTKLIAALVTLKSKMDALLGNISSLKHNLNEMVSQLVGNAHPKRSTPQL